MIPACPAWGGMNTLFAFFLTSLLLGPLYVAAILAIKDETRRVWFRTKGIPVQCVLNEFKATNKLAFKELLDGTEFNLIRKNSKRIPFQKSKESEGKYRIIFLKK